VTYRALLERLFARRRFGVRPGLDATRAALAALGDPHLGLRAIHVAGTNGKGSTAAIIDALLRAGGVRTGLYTSPHLSRFTERIRVDGAEIDASELAAIGERALDAAPEATFFEIVTVIAFAAFRARGVEVAVLETGLGGRLDATNVVDAPLATVVTGIAIDHAEVLGAGVAEIAREKAGIFKPGVPAVIGCHDPAACAVLLTEAERIGAPVSLRGRDFDAALMAPAAGAGSGLRYRGPGGALEATLSLAGAHQVDNAALALCAVASAGFALDPAARRRALAQVRWPGRLEQVADDVLVDAAHNPDGARALAQALPAIVDGRPVVLVFGVVTDKDAAAMFAALAPLASRVILTRPDSPRACDPAALRARLHGAIPLEVAPTLGEALAAARAPAQPRPVDGRAPWVVVTGSIFLAAEARARLLGEAVDPISAQDPAAGKNL